MGARIARVRPKAAPLLHARSMISPTSALPIVCDLLRIHRYKQDPQTEAAMNHRDAEVTDVVVVLDDLDDQQTREVVGNLKTAGLVVVNVDNDQSTVEGTIESQKVHDLKKVARVRYVRAVMTYTADYPVGDPRDRDGADSDAETDNED